MTYFDTTMLADAFVTLNTLVSTGGSRDTALRQLVDLTVATVPGCDWAGVTSWPLGRPPRSLVYSHEVARAVDELQHELSDGPCLLAAADTAVVRVDDLPGDDRWPVLALRAATCTPVRGVMSFHLTDEPDRAVLNLYSGQAGVFDNDAQSITTLLAKHVRVFLMHIMAADKAANLTTALTTNRQIGAAIGILMHAHKITSEQAFELLQASSQHLHRKLRDIADEVTETGTLPT